MKKKLFIMFVVVLLLGADAPEIDNPTTVVEGGTAISIVGILWWSMKRIVDDLKSALDKLTTTIEKIDSRIDSIETKLHMRRKTDKIY